jgi:PAS domain S-box-containing protein
MKTPPASTERLPAMDAPIRILHLEDDPADARLIAEQLRRSSLNAAITVAGSREAFEAVLPRGDFDLVLSDYHVPRFDGLEALELVRATSPQIPFILVTGALGDERAVELLRRGATDFVLKDRLARLAPAIQRALADREVRKGHEGIQAKLAEANRLSKLAAEAARMGTWQLHAASGTLDCSDEFVDLIGVERAHWGGTLCALEALMHPEDLERHRRIQLEAVRHRQFMELEFRIHKPDGEVRWMHLRGDCSLADVCAPPVFLGVMMDITERKKMEEALLDADRRKDEFLATLAHELRNPLAPIYNGLALLRRSALPANETERVHAMLERQMKHIIRLVDDLLDISRITLGKIALKKEPVELAAVVRSAVDMSRSLIEAAHQELYVSLSAAPIMLEADPVRLTQALSNLLNNASKYTEDGGQIWLSGHADNDRAVVSVRDTGAGIPEGMLERVFDLFMQGDRSDRSGTRGTPGLGIGLAMARLLVEMHGGDVEARSSGPGKGSEFIVRVPVSAVGQVSDGGTDDHMPDVTLSQFRVLVVDDNRDAADSLCMLLRGAGASAQTAYDGSSALEAIGASQPNVLLLDLGMPGMDGFTVARRIRQDPRHRHLTLIALTGWGQEQDRLHSLAAGFDHHLTKPADLNALKALFASLQPSRARTTES